ncbi:MAG: hypothetical protein KAW41_03245 [Candidatus Diapherotrites archaeon]|nr:hypothetical protein [Candidatus Diapherotrites archaeon]
MKDTLSPFVSFTISLPKYRQRHVRLEALVDTGSPFTVLSTREVLRMQIPTKPLKRGESLTLAGFKFVKHPLGEGEFSFRDEDGNVVPIKHPIASIIPTSTKLSRKQMNELDNIPPIIGCDFLVENNLGFYFNPSTKTAYFETP